ncbi:efflux RND transporter periplasmic adaptor subunit [Bacillus sp. FSL W7-1282]
MSFAKPTIFSFSMLVLIGCSQTEEANYTGSIEAKKQTIYSPLQGEIQNIHVAEREAVAKDELLVSLDERLLELQTAEAEASVRLADAEIEQAENEAASNVQLDALNSQRDQAQARLEQAQYHQSKANIHSPKDGAILEWLIDEGDFVQTGTPLVTILTDAPLETTIYVPQSELPEFSEGMSVQISAVALPGETFEGTVSFIEKEAIYSSQTIETNEDKASQVFPVHITIESNDEQLRAGMDVEIWIDSL